MARNVACFDVRPNTVEENDRILRQLQNKHQVDDINARDLGKLILKLNRNNVSKRRKSTEHIGLPFHDKNVQNVLYGPIPNFPPGSWWGIRMDCSRDRVHDPFNVDIQSGPMGAVSVCTSGTNVKEDVDFGEFLTLTGQLYNNSLPDKDPLVTNYKNQVPLRLIRSYNLTNAFAPKTGYRYDGLYVVISHWIGVSSSKQKYNKFALMRVGEQNPEPWNVATKSVPAVSVSTPNDVPQCSPCCAYKLRKSANSKDASNVNAVSSTVDQHKMTDSTIVTRRVFKKTEMSSESVNVPSTSSVNSQEALRNFVAKSPETHSTNISIRTNLYDSSHSVQQDVKKNSLMSFCRTLKPMSVTKHAALQKNVNHQVNPVRYSGTIGNLSNSRFKSSLADCLQARQERQTRVQNIDPKHVYASPEDKSKLNVPCKEFVPQNETCDIDGTSTYHFKESRTSDSVTVSSVKHEFNGKANDNADVDSEENSDLDQSVEETSQNLLHAADVSREKNMEEEIMSRSRVTDAIMGSSPNIQELKMFESFDSLTPDKILNLIDEEKCRPLSKLLIGNMIGLTPEESVILDTKQLLNEQNVKRESAINYTIKRPAKYQLPSRQLTPVGGDRKHEKILTSARRASTNNSTASEEDAKSLDADSSSRQTSNLRIFKLESSDDQEDSGKAKKTQLKIAKKRSTVKRIIKSSIKRPMYRKQRREITNLLIDAKIGPKIRGPRNRRLRHINDIYTKKRNYDSFSTVIYTAKKPKGSVHEKKQKRKADASGAQTNKSFELPSVSSRKRHANMTKIDRRFDGLRTNDTNNNSNKNDNNLRSTSASADSKKNCKTLTTLTKTKRRRTVQPTTESHRIGRTKRSRHICHNEQTVKPCTSDATTQCSFLSDFSDRSFIANGFAGWNNRSADGFLTSLRCSMNVKPEVTMDATKNERCCKKHACLSESAAKSCGDSEYSQKCSCGRRESCASTERVCAGRKLSARSGKISSARNDHPSYAERRASAFVPVNAIDNASRIAQLRSIGFKPIAASHHSGNDDEESESSGASGSSLDDSKDYDSKVIKRDVAEEYNKYASEENDVVIYMDEELQYQDIEEEEKAYSVVKEHVTPISTPAESLVSSTEYVVDEEIAPNSKDYDSSDKDLESPWHGWREITMNGKIYWIGW